MPAKRLNHCFGEIPDNIQKPALRKLHMIDAAIRLEELSRFPGNRLERLKGDRQGQCSIRINKKWRVCFIFENSNAYHVEIIDYH